tara:strand:+ start:13 stop:1149 length:1137 start_codon:yes stop_codon:yes gene_type:complete
MAFATIDLTKGVTGVLPSANANYSTPRKNVEPIMYNGDMAVAQRGTSFTGVSSGSNWPVDRFEFYPNSLGAYTIIQEALTSGEAYNNGFRSALRIDTTTADASPAATDYAILRGKLEGKDLGLFKKGTSNAEKFTLAFWVKSNKTTTGQVNLFDIDNDRLVSGTYTISSANTWEKKIINFPADTTGGFDNDNALSLIVEFFLDSGSNFSSGTAPTAWEAQTNADRNANNFAIGSSTDNDFAMTGVQLEVGEFSSTTIPPFQFETYGDNLARCQRYYYRMVNENVAMGTFSYYNSSRVESGISFPVTMRTAPSLVSTSGSSYFRVQRNGGDNNLNDLSAGNIGLTHASIFNTDEASGTAGHAGYGYSRGSGYLSWDAEI